MRRLCLLILGAVVLSGSACKTQNVVSGSTVYQLKQNTATHQNELWSYQVKTYSDELTPTADNLIMLDGTSMVLKPGTSTMIPLTNMPKALYDAAGDDYFFSDVSTIVKKSYKDFPANKPGFPVAGNLAVNQGYAVLQALTIPFKFRSAVSATVPSTVETGFTGNFSFGYKFARNYYKAKKDFLGLNRTGLSFTPGVFAGLGTASFSETTVPGAPTGYSRTSLTKSVGLFALVGIGRFGFGYAGGWDFASGDQHQKWIYQKKWWNGVAFSLDLVNF